MENEAIYNRIPFDTRGTRDSQIFRLYFEEKIGPVLEKLKTSQIHTGGKLLKFLIEKEYLLKRRSSSHIRDLKIIILIGLVFFFGLIVLKMY